MANVISTIDTDDILFKVISEAVEGNAVNINGGVYPGEDDRPDGSEAEDICINSITLTTQKPQDGTSNVNIYVKDDYINVGGKMQYKPARERLREIGDALRVYLEGLNLPDLELWVEADCGQQALQATALRQHYRNLRIRWNIH